MNLGFESVKITYGAQCLHFHLVQNGYGAMNLGFQSVKITYVVQCLRLTFCLNDKTRILKKWLNLRFCPPLDMEAITVVVKKTDGVG